MRDTAAYDLLDHRRNVYSQFGEDGILERILLDLGISHGWFVEFGAWDGRHLSTTRRLYDEGWSGVFIEGDRRKYQDLHAAFGDDDCVHTIQAMVSDRGDSALDALLASTPVPTELDVLCIDVDGDEYHIWNAVSRYEPRIVVVETNCTFPYNVEFVPQRGNHIGSSALAMAVLGASKGYQLVCYSCINCIFVRADLAARLPLKNRSFAWLFHTGRLEAAGGFIASDYRGHWHFLLEKPPWGWRKVFENARALQKSAHHMCVWRSPDELAALFDPAGLGVRGAVGAIE